MDSETDGGDAAMKRQRITIDEHGGAIDGAMEIELESAAKRLRRENGEAEKVRRENLGEEDEMEMKKVAEIVLVLSAMGRMRGGREPTVAEKAMMAEARKKVVALCHQLAPKDILPREAFGLVIEDLGLSRSKDQQKLGFRPPKLSISDKLANAKHRMQESKAFAAQPASFPSQRLQPTGTAGENRGTLPNVRIFSSDKTGHIPVSAGNLHSPAPAVHASSAVPTPLFRPPSTEVRPPVVSSPVPINTVRDSSSTVPNRAHLRPDGRSNGPSFMPQIPVSSSADQQVVRTTLVPVQPQATQWANTGTKNKVADNNPVRVDGNATFSAPQKTAQAAVGQAPKPVVSQTAPVTLANMHQPVQGMQFVHASPGFSPHIEISKLVQKVLNPKLPPRPAWTPPSREYMNKAVACQFCKSIINDVENVLVCDACEKGFHLGCLQSYNAKGIPRGEWHCPRCLTMNRGKIFPPKYGRVTRNMQTSKAPSNSAGAQLSSERKGEPVDDKANQPSTMTNGSPDFKTQPQAGKVAESSSKLKFQRAHEVNESEMSTGSNKQDDPDSEKPPVIATGTAVEASSSISTGTSSDKPYQQEVKSEISPSEARLASAIEPKTPAIPQVSATSDQTPTSSNQIGLERLTNGAEALIHQHGNCNGVVESNNHSDGETRQKDAVLENFLVGERVHDQARDHAESSNGLHDIDWVGDIDRVVDEKKFFQSCCINGVVYKVQDYALFRSGSGKLIPVKLQAMWEDSQTSSKWLVVHKCYFPNDLPEEVGRPGAPQSNEVYESTHDSNVTADSIQGPCEVLPFRKFGEEMERSNQGSQANDRARPVFRRNWFYDESRRAFCPSAS